MPYVVIKDDNVVSKVYQYKIQAAIHCLEAGLVFEDKIGSWWTPKIKITEIEEDINDV